MQLKFTNQFNKDILQLSDKKLIAKILDDIESFRKVDRLSKIKNIKKLKGYNNAFSIRIGDYRLGVIVEKEVLVLSRFLHRKEIYKYFP